MLHGRIIDLARALTLLLVAASCGDERTPSSDAAARFNVVPDRECSAADPGYTEGVAVVQLDDGGIRPDTLRVPTDRSIRLVVCNVGTADHQLLIGRDPGINAFGTTFFSRVPVQTIRGGVLAAERPAVSPEAPGTRRPDDARHAHPALSFYLRPQESASVRFTLAAAETGEWLMGSFPVDTAGGRTWAVLEVH